MRREHDIQQSPLPSGYQQLNYIQSSGTQYIKLGVIPTKDIHIKMDFQLTSTSGSALSMFGSTTYTDNTLRILLDYGSAYSNQFCSNWGNLGNNNTERTVNYPATMDIQRHVWEIGNGFEYFDGTSLTRNSLTRNLTSKEIFVFCRNDNGTANYKANMKLYQFELWDSGVHMLLYPALRIADTKPGLYDIIGNSFLINSGTGNFTYA